MNLYTIAKLILLVENQPLSKVRFAKTIYFVHKELINQGFAKAEDVSYIRMPLGPVPSGFMTLTEMYPDIISTIVPSGLSYNSVEYSVKTKRFSREKIDNPLRESMRKVLETLRVIRTSELVEISHLEPSWLINSNGVTFTISKADLANPIPKGSSKPRLDADDQLIQASLIKGMIDDIVSESTALEYPDDDKN